MTYANKMAPTLRLSGITNNNYVHKPMTVIYCVSLERCPVVKCGAGHLDSAQRGRSGRRDTIWSPFPGEIPIRNLPINQAT